MQCPPNTAKNEALLENVLATIVCILTKIPVFIIGETGSSKSLAIRLINSNLRGSDSEDEYFKSLPRVYLFPHQVSLSTTSDDIIKVFNKANEYQEINSKQFPVISVVLLENVELVETSPFDPLKMLHTLLEPNYPAIWPTVSVVGISNNHLDISKSGRALLVQSVLNKITLCVKTGRPLILTDLKMIYGNLYDLWNQNYVIIENDGNAKYFTRITLGACDNPTLFVSSNFKCILIMDEMDLPLAGPPLLNRFEKQKVSIDDILNDRQI
ncbi:unnamed protein product [Rhizophagus irregularis]|nr:unnamed protein product [Rhizophagus irregularis]